MLTKIIEEKDFIEALRGQLEDPITPGKKLFKLAQSYSNQQAVQIIENISHEPIEVFSEKEAGREKKFYMSRQWKDNLIKRISTTKI